MGMRDIRVEKVTLNIGCGTKTPIETARTVLKNVSGGKVVVTKTKKRSTFNVPKDKAIGCKITLRKGIEPFLKRLLEAKENRLRMSNFDNTGNFSFGIREYIDVPGMEYDPKMGVLGFDVCVTLERPGYRVKRKRLPRKLGKSHTIKKQDAIEFAKQKFGIQIEE
ncbi:MAG: 50S ribosomal protein L5 [Candidatus Aenigmarchaeota archaeon]|nr:50S ribosomal protein L5P [uncultured archaeon]MBS3050627.1 50S ribosomal protein L5 [Candidatus Aenigmarchaeota archaeon]